MTINVITVEEYINLIHRSLSDVEKEPTDPSAIDSAGNVAVITDIRNIIAKGADSPLFRSISGIQSR